MKEYNEQVEYIHLNPVRAGGCQYHEQRKNLRAASRFSGYAESESAHG